MKPTAMQRFRYWFDNVMARGIGAVVVLLAILTLLLVIVIGVFVLVFGVRLPGEFPEVLWGSLMRTLDPGTMGGDEGWRFRVLMLIVTIGGLIIVASLIGIVSGAFDSKVEELRKGRSRVLENDHTLILGWSPKVFPIISELVHRQRVAWRCGDRRRRRPRQGRDGGRDPRRGGQDRQDADHLPLGRPDGPQRPRTRQPAHGAQHRHHRARGQRRPGLGRHQDRAGPHQQPESPQGRAVPHRRRAAGSGEPRGRPAGRPRRGPLGARRRPDQPHHRADLPAERPERRLLRAARLRRRRDLLHRAARSGRAELLRGADGVRRLLGDGHGQGRRRAAQPARGHRIRGRETSSSSSPRTTTRSGSATARHGRHLAPSRPSRPFRSRPSAPSCSATTPGCTAILASCTSTCAPGRRSTVVADIPEPELPSFPATSTVRFQRGDTTSRAVLEASSAGRFDHIIVLADKELRCSAPTRRRSSHCCTCATSPSGRHRPQRRERDARRPQPRARRSDQRRRLHRQRQAGEPDAHRRCPRTSSSPTSSTTCSRPRAPRSTCGPPSSTSARRPRSTSTRCSRRPARGETAIGYRVAAHEHSAAHAYGVRVNPEKSEKRTFAAGDKIIVLAEG